MEIANTTVIIIMEIEQVRASIKILFTTLFVLFLGMQNLKAATVTMNVSGSLIDTNFSGTSIGDGFSGSFTYDSDSGMAYASANYFGINFYSFNGGTYGSVGNVGSLAYSTLDLVDVYIADNFPSTNFGYFSDIEPTLSSLVPAGNYDIFAVNAYDSGVYDINGVPVGSGVDAWAILVGNENFFSGSTLVASPNDLLTNPNLIGGLFFLDEYAGGVLTGSAAGEISPVPVPAAVWLFVSGLMALFGISRKHK